MSADLTPSQARNHAENDLQSELMSRGGHIADSDLLARDNFIMGQTGRYLGVDADVARNIISPIQDSTRGMIHDPLSADPVGLVLGLCGTSTQQAHEQEVFRANAKREDQDPDALIKHVREDIKTRSRVHEALEELRRPVVESGQNKLHIALGFAGSKGEQKIARAELEINEEDLQDRSGSYGEIIPGLRSQLVDYYQDRINNEALESAPYPIQEVVGGRFTNVIHQFTALLNEFLSRTPEEQRVHEENVQTARHQSFSREVDNYVMNSDSIKIANIADRLGL